ncbi:MAG: thiosulfate oxidation carrier protein SoxY [Terriglobales bacterium]
MNDYMKALTEVLGDCAIALTMNRRQALTMGAGVLAASALAGSDLPALAETNGFEETIKQFSGGRTPVEGRVNLDLPKLAEDGGAVPMTITVDSPMTEGSHVTDVLVVAEANPRPIVVTFHFSPASGVAEVSTRIRMAKTENIIAVAKMNDGSVYVAKKEVTVTVGGCGTS